MCLSPYSSTIFSERFDGPGNVIKKSGVLASAGATGAFFDFVAGPQYRRPDGSLKERLWGYQPIGCGKLFLVSR